MPYKDPEAKKAHQKIYRENHRANIQLYNKQYTENNRENLRSQKKQYYQDNMEAMKRTGKRCRNIRRKTTKIEAIRYKGGKCQLCGYNKCRAALGFHHLDPKQKDPKWNEMKSWSFDKIKDELDKCILICHNCHAEIHYPQHIIKEYNAIQSQEG